MKKWSYNILIVALYLSVPIQVLYSADAMVNQKYEVEEECFQFERIMEVKGEIDELAYHELQEKEEWLTFRTYAHLFGALIAFIIATILFIRRMKIKSAAHNNG